MRMTAFGSSFSLMPALRRGTRLLTFLFIHGEM
jgi:hypothetical protein